MKLSQLCTREAVIVRGSPTPVRPDADVSDAVGSMLKGGVRRLLVVRAAYPAFGTVAAQ